MKDEYLTYLFNRYAATGDFNALVGDGWREVALVPSLMDEVILAAFKAYGLAPNPRPYRPYIQDLFEHFQKDKAIREDGDEYVGHHFQFDLNRKNKSILSRVNVGPAHSRISKLGDHAFAQALTKIVAEVGHSGEAVDEDGADVAEQPVNQVPASDRLVTLNHNQIGVLDAQVSALVDEVEKDNGEPDAPGLRERLLGQVKAGRELIRSGEFRAYLLYEVLVRALNEIIEKYGNETVKSLANALLGAIVSQLFEGQ